MASIPLPALGIHQPEQPNLLGQASQIMALKGMQNQQQIQGIQLQQQQQQLKDQQAMTAAFKDWDGKDAQQLIKGVIGKGGSAQAVVGLQSHILQQRETLSKIAEQDATTGSKNIETQKARADALVGGINGLKNLPDDQLPGAVAQKIQEFGQNGVLNPQEMQQASSLGQIQDPKQLRSALDTFAKLHSFQSQQLTQAKDEADLAAKKAQLPGQIADSQKAIKVNAGTNAQGLTMEQQMQQRFEQRKQAEVERHNKATESPFGQSGNGVPPGVTGPEALKYMPPSAASAVKFYGDGNGDIATFLQRMNPAAKADFLAAVTAYKPDFKQSTYGIGKKVDEAFTSGDYSKKLNSIATAREHMKTFTTLAGKLDNGDVQAFNSLKNAIGVQFGSDAVTNFTIAKQFFSGEVGQAVTAGAGTGAEREELATSIKNASSWRQLSGALSTADSLLAGKQNALQQTYDKGKKAQPNFGEQGGSNGGTVYARDPRGKLHAAPAGTALPAGWKQE